MAELALHKGQSYATVFTDPETRQVLWVGKGRGKADIRPFFEWLGKRRCHKIAAVAMDLSPTFEVEVRHPCPNAEIVLDQFHVLANFGKQVLDRIQVHEANRCRDDKAARELIEKT